MGSRTSKVDIAILSLQNGDQVCNFGARVRRVVNSNRTVSQDRMVEEEGTIC